VERSGGAARADQCRAKTRIEGQDAGAAAAVRFSFNHLPALIQPRPRERQRGVLLLDRSFSRSRFASSRRLCPSRPAAWP